MNTVTVLYSLKNDYFEVRIVENDTYPEQIHSIYSEEEWNTFLNQYGSNPMNKGKRIAGSDQVNKLALERLLRGE